MDADIARALDEAMVTLADAASECEQLRTANEKLAKSEKILLQKVASTGARFDSEAIDSTLDRLVNLQLIHPEVRAKIASELARDPNTALKLCVKVAEALQNAPSEGGGIEKEASSSDHSKPGLTPEDPDGWEMAMRGEVPPLRK